jgi:chromosomal replication initiator protein
MWFADASITVEEGVLRVGAASRFQADWIERRYGSDLQDVAASSGGRSTDIYVLEPAEPTESAAAGEPAQASAKVAPRPGRRLLALDDMVVGPCNQLAWTATMAMVDGAEAAHMSPLFIHGECGVGKTHLLQGLCRRFKAKHPGEPMRYMTGEDFTNQYIQAVRHNQLERFRNTMRKLQLLAIDDVHFVAGKTRTQDEILHTLDAMRLTGARMVLASDAPPDVIKRFNKALASRCTSGMLAGVDPPGPDTRRNITHRLAMQRGLTITARAMDVIVGQCSGVREIQGLLARVGAVRTIRGGEVAIDDADVRRAMGHTASTDGRPITLASLLEATCTTMGIARGDLTGRSRTARLATARGLMAVLARECTPASYPDIARALGRSTHSSVHAAVKRTHTALASGTTIDLDGCSIPLTHVSDRIRRRAATAG